MHPLGEGFEVPAEYSPISAWTWFKVRPGHALFLHVVSSRPVWYRGHYVGKRMVPCMGESCALCCEGVGAQVRYVFGVMEPLTEKIGLIELGEQLGRCIGDRVAMNGGLRGMAICLTRYSASKLSRIEIEFPSREAPEKLWNIPEIDLTRALVLTWQSAKCPIPDDILKRSLRRQIAPGELSTSVGAQGG